MSTPTSSQFEIHLPAPAADDVIRERLAAIVARLSDGEGDDSPDCAALHIEADRLRALLKPIAAKCRPAPWASMAIGVGRGGDQ